MNKPVSMRDIGREMGVSAVTVSKALGDKEGVSKAVREAIKQKAKELGYRYPADAKADIRARDVGVLISDGFLGENEFYASLYQKLVQKLTKAGFYAMLEILSEKDERALRLPAFIRDGRVSALIVLGQLGTPYLKLLGDSGIPVAYLDFFDSDTGADAVISDGVDGAYCMTKRLIEQGHSQIGFVGSLYATSSIMDRYLGFTKAMISSGLTVKEEWVIPDRETRSHLISLKLPKVMPTAFVCNCDRVAGQLIGTLESQGYHVPKDVSVVGFDDYLTAMPGLPGITTYRVNQEGMASAMTELIAARLANQPRQIGRMVIAGEPVIRQSADRTQDVTIHGEYAKI